MVAYCPPPGLRLVGTHPLPGLARLRKRSVDFIPTFGDDSAFAMRCKPRLQQQQCSARSITAPSTTLPLHSIVDLDNLVMSHPRLKTKLQQKKFTTAMSAVRPT